MNPIHRLAHAIKPDLRQFGATVTDPSISRSLAAYWEKRFFDDMERLRVRQPDTLTRVTEYVPEIVSFVEQIVSNGYGYELDGSVYFDTNAFDSNPNHFYAKLEPWSKGNRELLEEGEGKSAWGFVRRLNADSLSRRLVCQGQVRTTIVRRLRVMEVI